MGASTVPESVPEPTPAAPLRAPRSGQATMIGMPAVSLAPVDRRSAYPTLHGMPASPAAPAVTPPTTEASWVPASRGKHATLLGMPAASAAEVTPSVTPVASSAPASAPVAPWSVPVAPFVEPPRVEAPVAMAPPLEPNATLPVPLVASAASADPPSRFGEPGSGALAQRDPLQRPRHPVTYDERASVPPLGAAPARPSVAPLGAAPARPSVAPLGAAPARPSAPDTARRGRSWLGPIVGGALLVLVLLGAGLGVYLAHRAALPEVHARLLRVGGQESVVLELPGVRPGSHVRFAGQDRALEEGRAVFPLGDRPLVVGENRLTFTLVLPDGTTERAAVDLAVAYRVFADLGGVDEDPPRLRIRAIAPPGTTVEIGGEPVRIDPNGEGYRDLVVGGSAAEGRGGAAATERDEHSVVQTVRYRILPPGGTVEEGEVHVRIPLATLALDRPGSSLVTDQSEIAVEGAAHPTATVTVDGTEVRMSDGHFKHVVGLADLGEHVIEVVAREPGAVPDRARILVRRVADLAAEARAYPVDESLTYAAVAADPAAHRGQHVGFEGLVYNVEVHRGHSMLQVLASRCGESRRCPLWVTYPAATDVALNSWVRVLGEVDGEQHFRTVGDPSQVMTVPRVRAVYVLPATR